jgi:hypothetical protein
MTVPYTLILADSEVAAATAVGAGIHIRLSAAHVILRGDSGTEKPTDGFSRGVELLMPGAQWKEGGLTGFVGRITEGRLCMDTAWALKISLPGRLNGPIKLELTFANHSYLELTATGLECRFEGEPNFSESLFC